jgi:hypothetical protein
VLNSIGGGRRDGRRSRLVVRLGELGRVVGVISLRAELLTLTSSGSVRSAHWRARHHDVSAELYAWLNREYARLGPYRRGRQGEREQHALTRRAALPLRSAD